MKPMQVMEAEHRLIETVVNALGGVAHAIEKEQRADGAMLATAVEFWLLAVMAGRAVRDDPATPGPGARSARSRTTCQTNPATRPAA